MTKCADIWVQVSTYFMAQGRNPEKKMSEGHIINNARTYISLTIITCQYCQYWDGKREYLIEMNKILNKS